MKTQTTAHGSVVKTITVDKKKLLGILNTNKEKHIKDYEDAIKGWRSAVQEVASMVAKTPDNGDLRNRLINMMACPESHADEYTRAIGMLDLDLDTTAELDLPSYSQFVDDDWGWKRSWTTSNSGYLGKR